MITTTKALLAICCVSLAATLFLAWYGWSLKTELRAVNIELSRAKEDMNLMERHMDAAGEALAAHQRSLKEAGDAARKSEYMLEFVPESWGDAVLPESVMGLLEAGSEDAGGSVEPSR